MIFQYIDRIKKLAQPDKVIMDEISQININSAFYLAIISIPVRLFTIMIFLNKLSEGGEKENIWRRGIIISHITYLLLMIILGIISYKLRKKNQPSFMTIVTQYIMTVTILFLSVVITSIDQLVTHSITPFIIACIAIGAIFIIRPLHSILMFLLIYIIYYFAMGIMQLEKSILLSNRINGFTSIILGIFLSFILWKSNVINLRQEKYIKSQQEELENKNKRLKYLATYDSLTGLANRRYFEEKVYAEISRIKRYDEESSLLILDIDNFKNVNDTFGHPIGDKVLNRFALLLKKEIRETDTIARIGGEEFAILLLNTDKKIGISIAEKLRQIVERETFIIDHWNIKITTSIGMTVIDKKTNSHEEGYKYADRALYKAKTNGRNKVEIELENNS